jgi:transcriptional regulator with XRE-family HTH domain
MPKSLFSRNYEILLERFRSARVQAGTQEEIAKRIGQTQTFVSKCERGERRIDVIELMMFCKAFRVDAAEFIRGIQRKMRKKSA